jgi:hypothetical protein
MHRGWPILLACGCGFSITSGGADGDGGAGDGSSTLDGGIDAAPWLAGWTYRKQITIHASAVEAPVGGVLSAFPVVFVLADAAIAANAPSVRFTAADESTLLSHEIESADATTLTAWVKIPQLGTSADTTIFVYYGHPTATAPEGTGVWTDNFQAVLHLQQDPGPDTAGQIKDATTNQRHGRAANFDSNDGVAGPRGRAIRFDGDAYVALPSFDLGQQAFTIATWFNLDNVSGIRTLLSNSADRFETDGFRYFVNSNGSSDRKIVFETGNGASGAQASTLPNAAPSQAWHHVVAVVDRAGGLADIVIDGVLVNQGDRGIRNDFSTSAIVDIGRMDDLNKFDGVIDDVQISTGIRPIEWIRTAWKNQSNANSATSTFYELGAEQTLP